MCIACEMAFFDMVEAMTPEARERFLREQEEAARFACDAPPAEAPQPAEDERKP
jgi:hypothetical protein